MSRLEPKTEEEEGASVDVKNGEVKQETVGEAVNPESINDPEEPGVEDGNVEPEPESGEQNQNDDVEVKVEEVEQSAEETTTDQPEESSPNQPEEDTTEQPEEVTASEMEEGTTNQPDEEIKEESPTPDKQPPADDAGDQDEQMQDQRQTDEGSCYCSCKGLSYADTGNNVWPAFPHSEIYMQLSFTSASVLLLCLLLLCTFLSPLVLIEQPFLD